MLCARSLTARTRLWGPAARVLLHKPAARWYSEKLSVDKKPAVAGASIAHAPENEDKPPTLPMRFVNALPKSFQPYAKLSRMDKPIGTWLLLSPMTWAVTMAAYATSAPLSQTMGILALSGIGAFVTRGAGCTINDIWDRDLDRQVARTMMRPLAAGDVSRKQAVGWLAAQCTVGLGVLLCLPQPAWALGASSMAIVAVYPLFKRFTYYPQVCLSACFTWGAMLGFPAMGIFDWPAMGCLYVSSFAWCMLYDTIYAHQDKVFDIQAGIKSTALKWGARTKPILRRLAVIQVAFLAAAGAIVGMGPAFFAATGIAAYRLRSMINRVNLDKPSSCWYWFVNNIKTGHAIFIGCFVDYCMRLLGVY